MRLKRDTSVMIGILVNYNRFSTTNCITDERNKRHSVGDRVVKHCMYFTFSSYVRRCGSSKTNIFADQYLICFHLYLEYLLQLGLYVFTAS